MHCINNDSIIIYDMLAFTKTKRLFRYDKVICQHREKMVIWNQQSIEVKGRIYQTGGAVANSTEYLKMTSVLNENLMMFRSLKDMYNARDAHGFISYADSYLIAVGSWHNDSAAKAEIYDIKTNCWHHLPQMNEGTCAPGLIVVGE